MEIPEPAVIQARLMEMTVPCDTCTEIRERDEGWASGCPGCQGSGLRYPLRQKCYCNPHILFEDNECPGFIFNADPDALTEFVRAKGWSGEHVFGWGEYGDCVAIYTLDGEELGSVDRDDSLRGQAALQLAVYRAMEGETDGTKD